MDFSGNYAVPWRWVVFSQYSLHLPGPSGHNQKSALASDLGTTLFASPRMLHLRVAFVTQAQSIHDHNGDPCEVKRGAKACTTPLIVGLCRAQSGSPFAFLSMPHLCVALGTQGRRFTEHDGHFSNILCRAVACTIVYAVSPTTPTRSWSVHHYITHHHYNRTHICHHKRMRIRERTHLSRTFFSNTKRSQLAVCVVVASVPRVHIPRRINTWHSAAGPPTIAPFTPISPHSKLWIFLRLIRS